MLKQPTARANRPQLRVLPGRRLFFRGLLLVRTLWPSAISFCELGLWVRVNVSGSVNCCLLSPVMAWCFVSGVVARRPVPRRDFRGKWRNVVCRQKGCVDNGVTTWVVEEAGGDSSTDSERSHSSLREKFGWGSIMRYVVTLRWTPTTGTHEWLLVRRRHCITPITRRELCIQLESWSPTPWCAYRGIVPGWVTVWRALAGGSHWMPWIVCPFVLWSERRCAAAYLFVLCRSVGVLCETRRPLCDRLAWRHCWTLCHALCDCVLGFFYDLVACFECFNSFSCHLHCIIGPTGSTMNIYIYPDDTMLFIMLILCSLSSWYYSVILEWTTSLDTSSSTLFVCRGPGTVSSGIYRPPQVIPVYPPGGDTRFFFICSRFPRGHYQLWLVRFSLV